MRSLIPCNTVCYKHSMKLSLKLLSDMKKNKEKIPVPISIRKYSGKFMVRIPPEVHRKLAEIAAEEGVSINRLVSARLAK